MGLNVYSLISGAVTISAFHAILPSHWLPFVLVGKAEKWSRGKILGVLTLAGGGHVFVTALLGFIAALIGKKITFMIGTKIPIASIILIVFGLVYFGLGLRGHEHVSNFSVKSKRREFATAASLFLMLTLTPCEPMVVVYFTAGPLGLKLLLLLTVVMGASTLGGMLILTYLALLGYERLNFPRLEKHERTVIGGILVILGILFAFVD